MMFTTSPDFRLARVPVVSRAAVPLARLQVVVTDARLIAAVPHAGTGVGIVRGYTFEPAKPEFEEVPVTAIAPSCMLTAPTFLTMIVAVVENVAPSIDILDCAAWF